MSSQNAKYVVGNWKMNGLSESLGEIGQISAFARQHPNVDVAIAPPFTLIAAAAREGVGIGIGAQDCHAKENGAHTGCIAAPMLKQAGASFSIIGHSERRADQAESNEDVAAKARALHQADMGAILCVGESLEQREGGNAEAIVCEQLAASLPEEASPEWLTIAYEPIWAIGTGRIPQMEDIAKMHDALFALLQQRGSGSGWRILYGGSVNGDNAADIFALDNVGGALVGGASLSAAKFTPIISAAAAA